MWNMFYIKWSDFLIDIMARRLFLQFAVPAYILFHQIMLCDATKDVL